MFAPLIAKTQTKAAASSTNVRALQSRVEQAHTLQRGSGNQPMPPFLREWDSIRTASRFADDHDQEVERMRTADCDAAPGASWNFSNIMVLAPDQANRSQARSALTAPPLLWAVQPKLVVGRISDPLEHEADRFADQVMRMTANEPSIAAAPPQLSRKRAACGDVEAQTLQTKRVDTPESAAEAPIIVHEVLRSLGQPLDAPTRALFEPRFDHDFSHVRVYTGANAAASARAMDALAYTVGNNLVFGEGRYAPGTAAGQQLLAHELTHTIQQGAARTLSPTVQREAAPTTPKALVDRYITLFMPDYSGLADNLLSRLPAESLLVNQVFDLLGENGWTIVASAMAAHVTDEQLAKIAGDSRGRGVLRRVVDSFGDLSSQSFFEKDQERVLFAISPEHKRLKEEPWLKTPEVKSAVEATGAKIQSIGSWWASGLPQFDEYSVTMDAMPPGVTPEVFLAEIATDLNKAVNDYWFDAINEFKRTKSDKPPGVGDIYHIDIKGPDNGSVMLVESTPDHFIFQTVTTAQDGTHPEYGSREFGFEKNSDGSVRFYTRGASKSGMLPGTTLMGRPIQKYGWTRLVTGISHTLENRGGKIRPGSITSWRTQK